VSGMGKKYLPYDQNQCLLLPPNLNDWLSEDHLARFISDVVDDLDLSEILDYYEKESRGAPPYDPSMMVKVRIFADSIGNPSSRVIEKLMIDDLGFRFLGAGNFPDHRTINDFRRIHHKPLANLFDQVLLLCDEAGLIKMDTVAIDGFKLKANASIDKNYTMKTLLKKEKRYKELAREIIQKGIEIDEEEDRIYGRDNSGWRLPTDALERVKKAKKVIESRKKKELEEFERKLEERERKEIELGRKLRGRKPLHPNNKKQKSIDGKQKKEVANTTDPDSRIMKTRRGFIQGYNPQLSVDSDTQIILAADLTQDHNDTQQLSPMLKQTIENTGKIPKHTTADAGYDNEDQIDEFKEKTDIYIPTQKDWKQRKAMREQPPPRGRIPNDLSKRERRERKLLTKKGKKIYKKRGSSVEPVIGQITSARGLSKLLLRGKEKGNSELIMYCTGHNLLKLWRKSMKVASC